MKYAAGRHLVAADPVATQSIEQKKHVHARRLRMNGGNKSKSLAQMCRQVRRLSFAPPPIQNVALLTGKAA